MGGDTSDAWYLYREIHKGLRYALFGVTALAGNTDGRDDAAVEAMETEWRDVELFLDGHHQHEDQYYAPLIEAHAPNMVSELARSHAEADDAIDRIDGLIARLSGAPIPRRVAMLQVLHLDLADLTAAYVLHLRFEEEVVAPLLDAAVPAEALAEVAAAIRRSMAPDDLCVFLRFLFPGLSPVERIALVAAMRTDVVPAVFERMRITAESSLSPADYQMVAAAGAFGSP